MYAYRDIDSRLIYYASKPVQILDDVELTKLRNKKEPFFLLVEDEHAGKALALADCKIKEFKPYLKKKKYLVVLGFGGACNAKEI